MSHRKLAGIFIGVIIPFLAIIGIIPFIAKLDFSVLGIPILYFWVFMWFPLTTLCLCISWHIHDRHQYKNEKMG
ncbi:DUF3311 domain-containing protein [Peribacillus simplex]|uniref:DUF3311 domain-containing protein n=1 Tax=Peribacillus simplex TaxID=1478 RepID=UPI003D9B5C69